ncbi:hypothetical protein AQUCO_01400577v1 [Aquilegia coerulea]|uniref:Pollen Ole e 1 allergen and extensin family protein n=1 Tax=Aquilegia coerulea TaxID=218851 RepID=A0A2G5DX45_AQUCA|nr:hypothetical protein AQUCO_01400577v1 [Aquilegia coerulea]
MLVLFVHSNALWLFMAKFSVILAVLDLRHLPLLTLLVRVVCKTRDSLQPVFSCDAFTDSTGSYSVTVAYDHEDQICESVLISSPQKNCAAIMPGRERANVILTNNNGIISYNRFANNLGFVRDEPLAACTNIKKLYEEEV